MPEILKDVKKILKISKDIKRYFKGLNQALSSSAICKFWQEINDARGLEKYANVKQEIRKGKIRKIYL